MKLRIQGNSVRVRLTRTEVAALGAGRRVEQRTMLTPSVTLISAVQSSPTIADIQVTYHENDLTILLPARRAQSWAKSDEVGIETTTNVGTSEHLKILIEKDFQCLHSSVEADPDAFPNPSAE